MEEASYHHRRASCKREAFSTLIDNSNTGRLFLGIFLINFEVTIVSTAVLSITNDLDNFSESSWIITAYLITYIGKNPIDATRFCLLTYSL